MAVAKKEPTSKSVKTTETKKTPRKSTAKAKQTEISPAERYRMIEVAAYYIAEKNSFSGNTADYWIQAEREINQKYPG